MLNESGGISGSIDRRELCEMLYSYMDDSVSHFLEMNVGFDDATRRMPTFGSQVVAPLLREWNEDGGSFRYRLSVYDKRGSVHDCVVYFNAHCGSVGGNNGGFKYSRNMLVVNIPFRLNGYGVPEWSCSPKFLVDVMVHELTHYVTSVNKRLSGSGLRASDMDTMYYLRKNEDFRSQRDEVYRLMGTSVMTLLYFLHFNERNSYATGSAEYMEPYINRIESSIRVLRDCLPSQVSERSIRYYYQSVREEFERDNSSGMYMPSTYGKMLNFVDRNYRKLLNKMRRQRERNPRTYY